MRLTPQTTARRRLPPRRPRRRRAAPLPRRLQPAAAAQARPAGDAGLRRRRRRRADATDKYAAVPAVPAVLTNCTPSSGDTAWMLTSVALVLMMTIPGLGLFYGGMVRKKNVGDTVMTSFAITCLVTVLYAVITYKLSFTGGTPFIGGLQPRVPAGHPQRRQQRRHRQSEFARADDPRDRLHVLPDDLRDHHAGADRRRLRGAHEVLGHAVVHRPVGDLRLRAGRPLGVGARRHLQLGQRRDAWVKVLDFAGGTVVHINAGVAGLVAAIMLGKRRDTGPGHNMVLTFIGAALLWVGWFGFNAGSAVSAGVQAGMAMTVTQIATAVAALTWMFVEWAHHGKPTVIGICSGAVAGLVAITPASGFVGPIGAMVIGVACGVGCYWGATGLKHMFGYDDALDCFGVHGVGGAIGALLTGVFAIQEYGGTAGLIEGNPGQVVNQCIGIVTVVVYDAIVTVIILGVIKVVIGLRVTDEVERDGLDLALHGEVVQ